MKSVLFLVGLFASASAWAAAPKYDLSSKEILGAYEEVNGSCTDINDRPCIGVRIKKGDGVITVTLENYRDIEVNLRETKKRALVFKWENPENDDCDDPGCYNILGISGVVYAKKKGRTYTPAVKLYVKKDYPFPDEDDAPEGEVTEVENFVKRVK